MEAWCEGRRQEEEGARRWRKDGEEWGKNIEKNINKKDMEGRCKA
jgi:hypothetical protein